ncbi:transposase [uncultured Microscilla sp.]|uniref:transposase n=1 Tax=uncultured Microscilla sp. TaxID=432653 RepID=UPI00262E978F|nr:transposase [uncultured Microscilla sp.]
MENNSKKFYERRSIRLPGYDYTQESLYYITLCCQNRLKLFGEVVNSELVPNAAGKMVEEEWKALTTRFPEIRLHAYVVMPNHFHAVVEMCSTEQIDSKNEKPPTLGNIIAGFKSIVTVNYIRGVKELGWQPFDKKVWQRNYWEHIIRNDQAYQKITEYIIENPIYWKEDDLYK